MTLSDRDPVGLLAGAAGIIGRMRGERGCDRAATGAVTSALLSRLEERIAGHPAEAVVWKGAQIAPTPKCIA